MIKRWDRRQCPGCGLDFITDQDKDSSMEQDPSGMWWAVLWDFCPGCGETAVWVVSGTESDSMDPDEQPPTDFEFRVVLPRIVAGRPVPSEVPLEFSVDYREACLILADSPKASAALSRRCLQTILREKTEVPHKDLYGEVRWVIENAGLPSLLVEVLDIPREIGNVGTHPMKNLETGMIADVERWEAEWCLEIIEALYEHYFVAPARNEERLQRLRQNRKGR